MVLFDQVKLGKLKPKEFLKCFVQNIGRETEESTLQSVIGNVKLISLYYLDAKEGLKYEEKAFKVLLEMTKGLENRGLQKFLLPNAIGFATSKD